MKRLGPLTIIGVLGIGVVAHAQPIGPAGDFRVDDRPGTAPTVGPPGGPSLPPGPASFRDPTGAKSPEAILKSLDKELGSSSLSPSGGRPFDLPRDMGGAGAAGAGSSFGKEGVR
jgi:hypothetical protein